MGVPAHQVKTLLSPGSWEPGEVAVDMEVEGMLLVFTAKPRGGGTVPAVALINPSLFLHPLPTLDLFPNCCGSPVRKELIISLN